MERWADRERISAPPLRSIERLWFARTVLIAGAEHLWGAPGTQSSGYEGGQVRTLTCFELGDAPECNKD
eukprot:6431354-Amphidinium_carterae.1